MREPRSRPRPILGGIFVGGASSRMGYRAKGLLTAPDGRTIVERSCSLFRAIGVEPILVGRHPAYAELGLPSLSDESTGSGPIGGIVALLRRAAERDGLAIALACDMPYVTELLLDALATHPSRAPIVAPRTPRGWEPFFARYDPASVLEVAVQRAREGASSLQGLLDSVATAPWELTAEQLSHLRDWDRESDLD